MTQKKVAAGAEMLPGILSYHIVDMLGASEMVMGMADGGHRHGGT